MLSMPEAHKQKHHTEPTLKSKPQDKRLKNLSINPHWYIGGIETKEKEPLIVGVLNLQVT